MMAAMGTQKLGLGPDSSFDSEDNLQRANGEQLGKSLRWVFNTRFGWLVLPFAVAVILTLMDWGGYRGKVYGWGEPRTLAEGWWHLPVWFVVLAAGCRVIFLLSKRY
jgi:hypothetical protein